MNIGEPPWGDHHHKSPCLSNMSIADNDIKSIIPLDHIIENFQSPILTWDTLYEGNIENITLYYFNRHIRETWSHGKHLGW